MDIGSDWPKLLREQLDFQWFRLTRPRLDGLTDREYFGEPVPDCWTLRPRSSEGHSAASSLIMDLGSTESDPPPFTTIAWRLAHVIRHILGARTRVLFDGPDLEQAGFAENAADALAQLDAAYERWQDGVSAMSESQLAERCGREEHYFEGRPLATLILHVNREVLCHCAEVSLLRDLYARIPPPAPDFARH